MAHVNSAFLRSPEHYSESGYVWTDNFDLNAPRVDGNIFESGKKELRIQKYADTCRRGLSVWLQIRLW